MTLTIELPAANTLARVAAVRGIVQALQELSSSGLDAEATAEGGTPPRPGTGAEPAAEREEGLFGILWHFGGNSRPYVSRLRRQNERREGVNR